MSAKVKVFIVSENRLLRDTLARIFEQEQDLAVVGAARPHHRAAARRAAAHVGPLETLPEARRHGDSGRDHSALVSGDVSENKR